MNYMKKNVSLEGVIGCYLLNAKFMYKKKKCFTTLKWKAILNTLKKLIRLENYILLSNFVRLENALQKKNLKDF